MNSSFKNIDSFLLIKLTNSVPQILQAYRSHQSKFQLLNSVNDSFFHSKIIHGILLLNFPDYQYNLENENKENEKTNENISINQQFSSFILDSKQQQLFVFCRRINIKEGLCTMCILSRKSWFQVFGELVNIILSHLNQPEQIVEILDSINNQDIPKPSDIFLVKIKSNELLYTEYKILRPEDDDTMTFLSNFEELFGCLEISKIISVFFALLFEKKIVLASSNFSKLSNCCHTFLGMLYPFFWPWLFIPVMPSSLITEFKKYKSGIIGVHSDLIPKIKQEVESPYLIVDLDNNRIERLNKFHYNSGYYPKEDVDILTEKLQEVISNQSKNKFFPELDCSRAFLDFFLGIFGSYINFINRENSGNNFVDMKAYVESLNESRKKFVLKLMKLKMIHNFSETHLEKVLKYGKDSGSFERKFEENQKKEKKSEENDQKKKKMEEKNQIKKMDKSQKIKNKLKGIGNAFRKIRDKTKGKNNVIKKQENLPKEEFRKPIKNERKQNIMDSSIFENGVIDVPEALIDNVLNVQRIVDLRKFQDFQFDLKFEAVHDLVNPNKVRNINGNGDLLIDIVVNSPNQINQINQNVNFNSNEENIKNIPKRKNQINQNVNFNSNEENNQNIPKRKNQINQNEKDLLNFNQNEENNQNIPKRNNQINQNEKDLLNFNSNEENIKNIPKRKKEQFNKNEKDLLNFKQNEENNQNIPKRNNQINQNVNFNSNEENNQNLPKRNNQINQKVNFNSNEENNQNIPKRNKEINQKEKDLLNFKQNEENNQNIPKRKKEQFNKNEKDLLNFKQNEENNQNLPKRNNQINQKVNFNSNEENNQNIPKKNNQINQKVNFNQNEENIKNIPKRNNQINQNEKDLLNFNQNEENIQNISKRKNQINQKVNFNSNEENIQNIPKRKNQINQNVNFNQNEENIKNIPKRKNQINQNEKDLLNFNQNEENIKNISKRKKEINQNEKDLLNFNQNEEKQELKKDILDNTEKIKKKNGKNLLMDFGEDFFKRKEKNNLKKKEMTNGGDDLLIFDNEKKEEKKEINKNLIDLDF
ncbi:denn domain-containing [Anaeramoeba ignava]|uniref:Denn domain-containing n=1 Tax=Anaeramoeba ignava TaxID=1746090 RepID=A0A9Q0LA65_ANAIG|nr:denn domain-containing [Anaeramoeba ignava]